MVLLKIGEINLKDGEKVKLKGKIVDFDMLPRREKEIVRLARNFKPLIDKKGAFSLNVAIIGNAGVGKTSIAQYFSKKFPEAASKANRTIKSVYYNCYNLCLSQNIESPYS